MTCSLPEWGFRQFSAGCLYPPCLPAGYTIVSGSSSGRMESLLGRVSGRL